MNDTFVLSGDGSINENIDGDLELEISTGAQAALINELDGNADLLSVLNADLSLVQSFPGEVGIFTEVRRGAYPVYTGAVNVIPKVATAQILETKNTSVLEDIEVEKIPVYETSNPSGGITVYIGGDISYG